MKLIVAFFLILLPLLATAQPVNEELSRSLLFNGEPYIAINPTNPNNLAVAWMSVSVPSLTIAILTRSSSDGGTTWSDPVQLPHQDTRYTSADVSMAWRNDGVLFLSYIDYLDNHDSSSGAVYVVSSTNGGLTWSNPIKAIDANENTDLPIDRPWIIVDNSNKASAGNLYITTKPAPWNPLPNHTYFTRSIDSGKTWSTAAILDTTGFSALALKAPMSTPAVTTDGTLDIVFPYIGNVNGGFALAKSTNGGGSFARSAVLLPKFAGDTLYKNGYRLIADPSDAQHLVLMWPDVRDGDNDIYYAVSFEGGTSWSVPVRVNDDAPGTGVVQDMLWPTFGKEGTLAVVWRDRRDGTGTGYTASTNTYYAYSTNGGQSFSKNFRMSDSTAPHEAALDQPGNDFMSAVLDKDTLYAVWADTRTTRVQVYFGKVVLGQKSWVSEQSLSEPATTLTIAPNPTAKGSETLHFVLPQASHCRVVLYNSIGAMVRELAASDYAAGEQTLSFSTTGLAAGEYVVRVETGERVQSAKLLVR